MAYHTVPDQDTNADLALQSNSSQPYLLIERFTSWNMIGQLLVSEPKEHWMWHDHIHIFDIMLVWWVSQVKIYGTTLTVYKLLWYTITYVNHQLTRWRQYFVMEHLLFTFQLHSSVVFIGQLIGSLCWEVITAWHHIEQFPLNAFDDQLTHMVWDDL